VTTRRGAEHERLKSLPHVGRSAELALLSEWLGDVRAGRGGIYFVGGQSGIGKTRLVEAIAERAARDKWSVSLGRVFPVERGIPYAVWSDTLLHLLQGLDAATRITLTRGGNWLGTICPAFAGGVADDEEAADGKARLLWNCTQFLTRFAERQPVLLILENLHLADSESLELLHFVARQIRTARVAIIGTYNEAELERSAALREMEQSLLKIGAAKLMRLEALTLADVERLLAEAFGAEHAPARNMAQRLFAWTRGHPYFVEETLKSLVESGRLYERDGHWLGWEVEDLDLPKSVQSAVGRRLEQLSPSARAVAGVAAVIGARVRFRDLQNVAGLPDDALLAALDELCRASLLLESPRSQDGDYGFGHPIIQDVIYESLGVARSRMLHATLARSLEQVHAANPMSQAELLAFHYARAGASAGADDGKAALYLAAAGRDAMGRHANRAAADYLSEAIERRSGEFDPTLVDDLAQVRQRLGEYDAAMALWERARVEAEARGNLLHCARVQRRMGLACYWSGRFEEALGHFDAALATIAQVEPAAGPVEQFA
jgi:predicted ATPase